MCYWLDWQLFKNDEKNSFFHLKSFFRSQDILVFVRHFCHVGKSSLIRKIRLTSKFITSQPGLPTIPINILPNNSQSKSNQTMKLDQLIEQKKNIFLQKLSGKWGRGASSRPLFIFWKSLLWGESKWSAAYLQFISIVLNLPCIKNKLYKILDYWSRDMLDFHFSEKGLGLVSPHILCMVYKKNVSHVTYY